MKSLIKNKNGLTLVELLAVITISGIITIIVFGIFFSGQNQAQEQQDKNTQLKDIAYVLKVLTRDIRKSDSIQVQNINTIKIGDIVYAHNISDKTITKNGSIFVGEINRFEVKQELINEESIKIIISISSIDNVNQTTEIVLRR